MTHDTDIIVLGSGIAGMMSALVCAGHGYTVKIIGKQAVAKGAMQLAQNSYESLSALHDTDAQPIAKQVLVAGYRLEGIQLMRLEDSHIIASLEHPQTRYYASICKKQLMDEILQHCEAHKNIQLYNEYATAGMVSYDRPVGQIITEDKILHQAEYILGADGPTGLSRKLISSAAPEIEYCAMRTEVKSVLLPAFFSDRQSRLMLGDKCHLVSYPFSNGDRINLVFCVEQDRLSRNWQQHFFAQNPALHSLMQPDIHWQNTSIMAPFSAAFWRYQRLTLIGDAAHIMPPHLAQGAGQSFEDIAMLDKMLARYPLREALDEMAKARMHHASSIAQKAALTGKIMRLGGLGARLRNQILNLGGEALLESWMKNIWSYQTRA